VKPAVALPAWSRWEADPDRPAWTVGIEEEVMLLDPADWSLAHRIDTLLPELSQRLAGSVSAETHACTLELGTGAHTTVRAAAAELYALRVALAEELDAMGLRPAVAGTHPFALGHEIEVSGGARYQLLHEGLRVLARREPTFALHVHVGVPDAELAVLAADRLRAHLPLILALSANSPFFAGRDAGMASVRTPLFQAFPRAGVPRRAGSYAAYVERLDVLFRAGAFPEPTFVWSDVRLQPRFGTVEVRVADAQTGVAEVAAIAAVIQALVRTEATDGLADEALVEAQEVIEENRFLAARDGMAAQLVDPVTDGRVHAGELFAALLEACADHAAALDSRAELEVAAVLARRSGADRQRQLARAQGLQAVLPELGAAFLDPSSLVAEVAALVAAARS
jgi:glutamate---cysteine ligase / carboxylate-amine ligase